MKTSLRWKSVCVAVATIALCNLPMVASPAMAKPPICTQYGWIQCDPLYERLSPEWFACFDYWSTAGCPWWDGTLTSKKTPTAVKLEDMEKLVRQ